jgi:uncharacterized surface protein with fasciclin (FAS1) repeats
MNYNSKIFLKFLTPLAGLIALFSVAACSPTTTPTAEAPTTTETTPPTTDTTPVAENQTPSPTPTAASGDTQSQPASQLLQQASAAGSYKTLAQAIEAAGVSGNLQSLGGTYTIFAPNDEAFAALPPQTLSALLKPENRTVLTQILAYHIVPSEYTSQQIKSGSVKTLNGNVSVKVSPQGVLVNNASVVQPDIKASNAVIHGINQVLIPQNLQKQLSSLK